MQDVHYRALPDGQSFKPLKHVHKSVCSLRYSLTCTLAIAASRHVAGLTLRPMHVPQLGAACTGPGIAGAGLSSLPLGSSLVSWGAPLASAMVSISPEEMQKVRGQQLRGARNRSRQNGTGPKMGPAMRSW